jgi:very-short-patch-repair endonuclease
MPLRDLHRTADDQLGLVTAHQVREEVGDHVARTLRVRGTLEVARSGVFRIAGSARSWEQSVMAAVIAGGEHAAASHHTAAALWDMPDFHVGLGTPLHVTVPRGTRPSIRGVTVHTTLLEFEACTRRGVWVTSAARTLVDLDGFVAPAALARCVDEMLLRRLVSLDGLWAVHSALRRGSRRSRAMTAILSARTDAWERADSRPELRILRWLREARLPEPVLQHRVDRYRVDLAYPEQRIFIEYDGFDAHVTRTAFDGDRRRANELQLTAGAIILRYTSSSTREQVVREVATALARRTTPAV